MTGNGQVNAHMETTIVNAMMIHLYALFHILVPANLMMSIAFVKTPDTPVTLNIQETANQAMKIAHVKTQDSHVNSCTLVIASKEKMMLACAMKLNIPAIGNIKEIANQVKQIASAMMIHILVK